jgi:hypothetical protein
MPGNRSTPLLCLVILVTTGLAYAQDRPVTKFWPLPKINFPMDVQQIQSLNPKPVSIRFYSAEPNGKFVLVSNKKVDDLEEIIDTADPRIKKRGFSYTANRSSEVEFAVQYEYSDGVLSPPTSRLATQYRVHFLLEAPSISVKATGSNSIRWKIEESEYVVPASVRLEGRYPGRTNWQFLKTGELRLDDSFPWNNLPADETLEVRVYAKNNAGHEGRSAIMTLGANAGKAPRAMDDKIKAPGLDGGSSRTGFGNVEDLPTNRVKIEYLGTNKLKVKSKITHITRSGVKEAVLFVQNESTDWKKAGTVQKDLNQNSADTMVEIPYEAPKDGIYRFIVQPISGAGTKAEDPRPNDPAQYIVFVDTTAPTIKLKSTRVAGGGLNGPLIEIEWEASDAMDNLMPEPITLQYSDDNKTTWKPIHDSKMISNKGNHTWEIKDKQLWKFHVRATATDQAGNINSHETTAPVLVDLDKPSGTVEKVDGDGAATIRKQASVDTNSGGVYGAGSTSTVPDRLPITSTKPVVDAPAPGVGGRLAPIPTKPELPKVESPKVETPKVETPKSKPMEPEKKADLLPTVPLPTATPMPLPETKPVGVLEVPPLPKPEEKK